jgi:7-cyano-7-deazaguanine synthase
MDKRTTASISWPPAEPAGALAVLVSGGADSAILVGEAVGSYKAVHPLYIRTHSAWEEVEIAHLRRFLTAIAAPVLRPLHVLDLPVTDLYGRHWSITGDGVPDHFSADEAVFLPGRNVLLLSKALVWCSLNNVPELALAILNGNPFPDATPEFFSAFAGAVNAATGSAVNVIRPYANLSKAEVLRRGRSLPLDATFSCIRPAGARHCGRCNKCAERSKAFLAAGIPDLTPYA